MALFTDGPAVTIDQLTQHDSNLLEVSAVEGINVTDKLSLAQEAVHLELLALLDRDRMNSLGFIGMVSFDLRNIVVTSPIRLWQTFETLVLIYRDAYFGQLNDRYKAKWGEYRTMAKLAKDKLLETGLGVVSCPVSRAGAPTIVEAAAGESGGTFYISVSFLNAAGEEGQASSPISVTTTDGTAPDVQAQNPPPNANGWNLYAGTAPEAMYLQTFSPQSLGADFVFYPSAAATTGNLPGNGQSANFYKGLPRYLQRG